MASNAGGYSTLKEEVVRGLQAEEPLLSTFRQHLRNRNVTIFLGNTRSGKSTLINYLLDNNLEAYEERKKIFKIRVKDECEGPTIGYGSLSCTSHLGLYSMPGDSENVLVDAPGFDDNRGVLKNIINALCVNQIKAARTVKFVLVSDMADIISCNIGKFEECLRQTQDLVENFDELSDSFSVIFTKDPLEYLQDDIVELFQTKILNEVGLAMDRTLVSNWVHNKKLIGIFRMPERAEEITSEIEVNIKGAIAECREANLEECRIHFALSDRSEAVLLEIYPEYTDTAFFESELHRITEEFKEYFDIEKYVYASYSNELRRTKQTLGDISKSLLRHARVTRTTLSAVRSSLLLLPKSTSVQFNQNFNFMVMLDCSGLLEEQYKQMIIQKYSSSLLVLRGKIDRLLIKINAEMVVRRDHNRILGIAGGTGAVSTVPSFAGGSVVLHGVGNILSRGAQTLSSRISTNGSVLSRMAEIGVSGIRSTGNLLSTAARPGVSAYAAGETLIGATATALACGVGVSILAADIATTAFVYRELYKKRYDERVTQRRRTNFPKDILDFS